MRGPLRPRRLLLLLEGDQGEVGVAQGQVHRGEGGAGAEGPAGRRYLWTIYRYVKI